MSGSEKTVHSDTDENLAGSPPLSEETYSDTDSIQRTPAIDARDSDQDEFTPTVAETEGQQRSAHSVPPVANAESNHENVTEHQRAIIIQGDHEHSCSDHDEDSDRRDELFGERKLDSDFESATETPLTQETTRVEEVENDAIPSERSESVRGTLAIVGSEGDLFESRSDSETEETAHEPAERGASPSGSPAGATRRMPSPTQQDLFGDADDVSSEAEDEEGKKESLDQPRRFGGTSPEGPATDEQVANEIEAEEEIAETLIDVEIPKISADLGSQLHFVKFPNFLSVEPRPFDPDTYEDEIDDDDVLDEEGRSRVKLKVENTIRWRQSSDPDGSNVKRASNAKIVRWSDGSMSLYLGSEVFDVHTHPLQGDHHHLFIRQGTGLQGRAIFRTKLTFRPHSTESFTHRKMTLSMADRTSKTQKVKVLPAVGKDPEALKQELMKREEERLRASARRESQQRRSRERMAHGRGGLSAGYLEPDRGESDDDNGVSISAIKRSFKAGGKDFAAARAIYASDDEEDDDANYSNDERGVASSADQSKNDKQLERAKRLDSDEEDVDLASPDDRSKKRRANVVADDDDE